MEELILQPQVTLGQALIGGISTYRNGCNFRLIKRLDNNYWLSYGCYCLINLATGHEKLLINWLGDKETRKIVGVSPDIIAQLLFRPQCSMCGGDLYQVEGNFVPFKVK